MFSPYLLDIIDINLKVKVVRYLIYDKLFIILGSDIVFMANQENIFLS